jgi:hypothetical protein
MSKATIPFEKLFHAVHCYLHFFEAHSYVFDVVFDAQTSFKDEIHNSYFNHLLEHMGQPVENIRNGITAGLIRAHAPEDIFITLTGAMNFFIALWVHGGKKFPLTSKADVILDIFLSGILTEKGKDFVDKNIDKLRKDPGCWDTP